MTGARRALVVLVLLLAGMGPGHAHGFLLIDVTVVTTNGNETVIDLVTDRAEAGLALVRAGRLDASLGPASGDEDADALTEEELRYAASLTPLLEDKRRIYEGALKTGLSWPACHNLGLIYLKMSDQELAPRVRTILLKKAVQNLTYAAHRNPLMAELWYHLAVAQQRLGNVLESLHAFDYAAKATGPRLQHDVARYRLCSFVSCCSRRYAGCGGGCIHMATAGKQQRKSNSGAQ